MMNGHREPDEQRFGPRAFLLRPGVVAGFAAAALAVGWIFDVRGDGVSARDAFVGVMLVLAALAGIIGSAIEVRRIQGVALAWASASMLSIGAISLGSIGLPLLVAGALAAAAMLGSVGYDAGRRTVFAVGVSMLASFGVVFAGVVMTR